MMIPRAAALIQLLMYYYCSNLINADCTISTNNDITNPQVLILKPEGGKGNDAFFMPDLGGDIIRTPHGRIIYTSCERRNCRINGVNIGRRSTNITCSDGNRFEVLGNTHHFSEISCHFYPMHIARLTGNTCLEMYSEFEIGFKIKNNFITLITGCFDQTLQTTIYTLMELPPNIEGFQSGLPRPSWLESNFYKLGGIPLNTLYTRNMQRVTINNLLGLEPTSTKYVHETNNFFLARAHLAARADFIYGTQQRATFYFINAAPKWQTFNAGNWLTLESNIRRYVIRIRRKVLLYTGTYGIATLPHEQTGADVELFLFVDKVNNNKAIPVPQLYWKAVYEPVSRTGTVFLGVNNPFLANVSRHIICPNICDKINWLTWTPNILKRGYSYCCSIDSFRGATGLLPNLKVVDVLR